MITRILVILVLILSPAVAAAQDWVLDGQDSTLSFVSVKADEIGEIHRFGELDGHVGADGSFHLTVHLASVETGIDIRDERMRKHFFEVTSFPNARISGSLDNSSQLQSLMPGESMEQTLDAVLSLHGAEQAVSAMVSVYRLDDDTVLVASRAPVLLHAADFDLMGGLDTLAELAGLPSITPVVPVSFVLRFSRSG